MPSQVPNMPLNWQFWYVKMALGILLMIVTNGDMVNYLYKSFKSCYRCTLAQANQEIQKLDKELKQACKIAEAEKQEMLQEVERLTSQWRDLSVVAAGEKQDLIKEVQKLNDDLREVTDAAAVEKQEIRDEVLLLQLVNTK